MGGGLTGAGFGQLRFGRLNVSVRRWTSATMFAYSARMLGQMIEPLAGVGDLRLQRRRPARRQIQFNFNAASRRSPTSS